MSSRGGYTNGRDTLEEIKLEQNAGPGVDASTTQAHSVSVVIPCFNEEKTIEKTLGHLAGQYDSERYEIIVVDGMSTDRTREVVGDFISCHREVRVRVVDNPARNIPTALNLGIEQARGEIIVRMDAHSIPSPNYVRRCVQLLEESDAEVVGMPWRITAGADTVPAHAIALALSHPFGVGDSKYHYGVVATQYVDHMPFGSFRKSLWENVGGFNENLLTNEDYEFSYRIRRSGRRILLDSSAHAIYFARTTFRQLAQQYLRYGLWKAQMLKLHPTSVRWRQLVAPGFVLTVGSLGALSFFWRPALLVLAAVLGTYLLSSLLCAYQASRKTHDLRLVPATALAFMLAHISWGLSFLMGMLCSPDRN